MSTKPKIIVITGPTGSGKTNLAADLAPEFNGIVLTADSRQVYRGMNIGTSKIEGVESNWNNHPRITVDDVDHFLVNLVAPDQEFTLKDYSDAFWKLLNDLAGDTEMSTKTIIVAGGTGLYIFALIHAWGLEHQAADSTLRPKLVDKLEREGLEALVSELKQLSPESVDAIDTQNPRRVIRALEHVRTTGEPWKPQKENDSPLDYLLLGIQTKREQLNTRIDARVDEMMQQGLLEEVQALAQKYDWSLPAMSGIGYKELGEHVRGETTLEEAVQNIKTHTRQYAKRQLTWWRKEKNLHWIENVTDARALTQNFLSQ